MAVRMQVETIISCDGLEGRCPEKAQLRTVVAASTSISQARKLGWLIEDEVQCPACTVSPQTQSIPMIKTHYAWPTQLIGSHTSHQRPSQPEVRHLRLA